MYKIAILAAILAAAQASTDVDSCIFNRGELPTSVSIAGCTDVPCQLPQLQDANLNINFKSPRKLENLRTLATVYLNTGTLQLPVHVDLGAAANTCDFLDTGCPVDQDTDVNYNLNVNIGRHFPIGFAANVEFQIVDDGPLYCIRVPLSITPPLSNE